METRLFMTNHADTRSRRSRSPKTIFYKWCDFESRWWPHRRPTVLPSTDLISKPTPAYCTPRLYCSHVMQAVQLIHSHSQAVIHMKGSGLFIPFQMSSQEGKHVFVYVFYGTWQLMDESWIWCWKPGNSGEQHFSSKGGGTVVHKTKGRRCGSPLAKQEMVQKNAHLMTTALFFNFVIHTTAATHKGHHSLFCFQPTLPHLPTLVASGSPAGFPRPALANDRPVFVAAATSVLSEQDESAFRSTVRGRFSLLPSATYVKLIL